MTPRPAVIVGCLPAFKSLIANRAATRSKLGYPNGSGNKSKQNSNLRKTSIPLDSFAKEKKSPSGWHPSGTDSQEEMVKHDDANAITVKNDVVSGASLSVYTSH
jgi:hypothetical protein